MSELDSVQLYKWYLSWNKNSLNVLRESLPQILTNYQSDQLYNICVALLARCEVTLRSIEKRQNSADIKRLLTLYNAVGPLHALFAKGKQLADDDATRETLRDHFYEITHALSRLQS